MIHSAFRSQLVYLSSYTRDSCEPTIVPDQLQYSRPLLATNSTSIDSSCRSKSSWPWDQVIFTRDARSSDPSSASLSLITSWSPTLWRAPCSTAYFRGQQAEKPTELVRRWIKTELVLYLAGSISLATTVYYVIFDISNINSRWRLFVTYFLMINQSKVIFFPKIFSFTY